MGLIKSISKLIGKQETEQRHLGSPNKPTQQWTWDRPASMFSFFDNMVSMWSDELSITQDNILSLDAWWRGVRVISDSISGLPVNVYRTEDDGTITEHREHIAYSLLNIEASPSQGHFTWKSGVIDSTLNTGDSFSYIVRSRSGKVKYLIPLWPGAVSEWKIDKQYNLYWKIDGLDGWVDDRNIFHIMGTSLDGVTGLNPVEVHRMNLTAARGATQYAEKLMKNGAFLPGVIEMDGVIGERAHESLKNSWHEAYGGVANSGKVPILDKGMKYKPITLSPVDAEWLGMRKDLVAVVSRILGVPMHLLSELGDATYSNIEFQSQEFERYSLRPWIERLEAEIRRKLFTREEIESGYYVSFDTEALLRGNLEDQASYYRTMFNIGTLNQNEIRSKINKGPIPLGDRFYIQGNNMVPTDRIDEMLNSNIKGKLITEGVRKRGADGNEE